MQDLKSRVIRRLSDCRGRLLSRMPFYGNLVMHLDFALTKCGTACTNMKKIIFDPEFVDRISDEELDFLIMHEVLHCALQHCVRGRNKNHHFFNIACDIVVNSNILQTLNVKEFIVAGEPAMHITPDGDEGYKYSVEEVYDMLIEHYSAHTNDANAVLLQIKTDYGEGLDNHDIWNTIPLDDTASDEWKSHLIEASNNSQPMPPGVRDFLKDINKESRLNWRELLHDYIKIVNDRMDFSFTPPDRRFQSEGYILPSFTDSYSEKAENLWFVVDTSASISRDMLADAFAEISAAINQFEHLSGSISFFDTKVTEPVSFETIEDLQDIKAMGGGGTSFYSIFNYMKEHISDELPTVVIILTDGYAAYPTEEYAMGVPVLWLISRNKEKAPWGNCIMMDEI